MAYIWGPRFTADPYPIWGPQLETEPQSVGGVQLSADYGLIVSGSSVVSVPASMSGRSGLIAAGYQQMTLSVVTQADTGLIVFGFPGESDIGSGEVVLDADYGLEIVGSAEIESEGVSLESDYGLTIVGFDLGASTPQIEAIVAQVVAGVSAALPTVVAEYIDSAEIRPGLTRGMKEYIESAAIMGKHTEGKVLPGTQFPVAPGTVMRYMDPLDPTKPVIEYTIDSNGNRVPTKYFDKDGNEIIPGA